MRILISFDGSEETAETLNDLRCSGIPDETEALFLMIRKTDPMASKSKNKISVRENVAVSDAFPKWRTTTETASAWPAPSILLRAKSFKPDIIVFRENPKLSSAANFHTGATTNGLLAEAECSVRIVRPNPSSAFQRILVAFDGSPGAIGAIESIAARKWPAGTEVRLLAVADYTVLESIGRFTPQMKDVAVETKFTSQWAETLAAASVEKLAKAGISSSVKVRQGHARDEIVDEARNWKAGSIFLGPHCSGNKFECCLLGSVSAAVVAFSPCSVEVVKSATALSRGIQV